MIKGINYNAGTEYDLERTRFEAPDPYQFSADLEWVSALGCNAIRIYGTHPLILLSYAEQALNAGFGVWLCPRFFQDDEPMVFERSLELVRGAERLRRNGGDVTYIIGNEISIDSRVVYPFDDVRDRIELLHRIFILRDPGKKVSLEDRIFLAGVDLRLDRLLTRLRRLASDEFRGPVTYTSGFWEKVDWSGMNMVGFNHYLGEWNRSLYASFLAQMCGLGLPAAVMEFGCCAHTGAAMRGSSGYLVADDANTGIKRELIETGIAPDEEEQARHLARMFRILEQYPLRAVFVFELIDRCKPFSSEPARNLDMSSFGILRHHDGGCPEPKEAVAAVREMFAGRSLDFEEVLWPWP